MQKRKHLIFLGLILLINCIVFSASLYHPARSDQVAYLIDSAHCHNFNELVGHSYSFNRTRQYMAGDRFLFRPLFFTVLSLEQTFFGYDFRYWQVTGFLLHLIVLCLLLRIMFMLKPHWLAYILVFHFSVFSAGAEMVIWHHVHGYLIFVILILLAFKDFLKYRENNYSDDKYVRRMFLYLLLAIFFLEFGIICCFLFFLAVVVSADRSKFVKHAMLLAPVVIFALVNLVDWYIHYPGGSLLGLETVSFSWKAFLKEYIFLIDMALILPFIPAMTSLVLRERTILTLNLNGSSGISAFFNLIAIMLIFLLVALWLYFLFKNINAYRNHSGSQTFLMQRLKIPGVLTICTAGIYILLILGARTFSKHPQYIRYNLYHLYIIWVWLTMGIYIGFTLMVENFTAPQRKILCICFAWICVITGTINAAKLFTYNQSVKNTYRWWGRYINDLSHFIEQHKNEQDFSYEWFYRYRGGHMVHIKIKDTEKKLSGYISDLIFEKYKKRHDPKYFLIYLPQGGIVSFKDPASAQEYLATHKIL